MEETIKAGVVDVCVDMQQRARDMAERYRSEMGRFYYVTPTSYLELINTFKVGSKSKPISASFARGKTMPWNGTKNIRISSHPRLFVCVGHLNFHHFYCVYFLRVLVGRR